MENKTIDPGSRSYDFKDIEPDERFVQITKEVWVVCIVFSIHVVLLLSNLFVLGADPGSYTYIAGFPLWLFLQLCEFVAIIITVFIIVDRVFMNMDVSPKGKLIPRNMELDPDGNLVLKKSRKQQEVK